MYKGSKYTSNNDGRDFFIRFKGLGYDIPQFEILSDVNTAIAGNNVTFNSTFLRDFDPTRIFYEPIPFDFLYTNESMPQVIVSVDGIPAVCVSLNCGYVYEAPVAQITAFSLSGSTLTIQGTGFSNIQAVMFSHVNCANI